eukprot:TRINITY_DN18389_c0_g1_i1.p1 TRINITY_DN18389_c0_g1~~TRINITY_DN18389_c0_g1_i1.p1  ORF type:complete len:445 (+),score=82.23 TRINITY_DN18389_c0_g1_i1:82-1416(+)
MEPTSRVAVDVSGRRDRSSSQPQQIRDAVLQSEDDGYVGTGWNQPMSGSMGWDRTSTLESHMGALSLRVEDYTPEFWRPLQSEDESDRAAALTRTINVFETCMEPNGDTRFVLTHLATVVRYATEVPFRDLRDAFQRLAEKLREAGFHLPEPVTRPSLFIPKAIFQPIDTDDPLMHSIFAKTFVVRARVTHLNRVQCLHPTYFEHYWELYLYAMRDGEAPLTVPWRSYIAILVAASLNCRVLVDVHEEEFLLQGGPIRWLQGVESAPAKMRNLLPIVHVLCHQPWRMDNEYIGPLLRAADESWSLAELVHAMVIISTIKSLCGLVFGCGVTPEVDLDVHWRRRLAELLGETLDDSDGSNPDEPPDYDTIGSDDDDNRSLNFAVSTQRIRELLLAHFDDGSRCIFVFSLLPFLHFLTSVVPRFLLRPRAPDDTATVDEIFPRTRC